MRILRRILIKFLLQDGSVLVDARCAKWIRQRYAPDDKWIQVVFGMHPPFPER